MSTASRILVLAAGILLATRPVAADDAPQQDPGSARPPVEKDASRIPEKLLAPEREKANEDDIDGHFAFDYLKKLAGTWSGARPDGTTGTAQTFTLGAAGTALVGTAFPGTDQEIVSVFFLEGDELSVTHYDPAGSQPRLRFDSRKSYPGRYYFKFAGGTGFDRTKDRHIHEGSIQFHSLDQITIEWVSYDGLSRIGSRSVKLQRDPEATTTGSR